jgi:preprotein translocase subunit Sec63
MTRLLVIAILVVLGWRLMVGRWPWQPKIPAAQRRIVEARRLLGVAAGASREEVQMAHRRLIGTVHPDRGGSNAQVHEANAARDLLLAQMLQDPKERA